jgi:ElaB/YqjD/DUF883 family membrane-anchored ribosome-binding protein
MANSEMPYSNVPPETTTGAGYNPGNTGAGSLSAGSGNGSGMDPATERRFERVVTGAHEAVDSAATSIQQASERLRTQAQRFTDFEREMAETCRVRVRENPLSYLAGALVLGVLLGRLSR